MYPARILRPTHRLMMALTLCAALAALAALAVPGRLHAQDPAGAVAAATAHLAEHLDVDPAGLAPLRAEAVVWSNGCLGVYSADGVCTTALVDGFALWLSDGDVAYRYHTNTPGTVVRLAESGIALGEVAGAPLPGGQIAPPPPPEPAPPQPEPAPGPAHAQAPAGVVAAATANLAEQLEVDPAGLALLRAEAVVWSDGCLGVHEPDIDCTDAEVDGFALWLSDGDVAYRYHTDATGSVVRLAESGIALGEVAGAPLPGGQIAPPPPPEPAPPQPEPAPGPAHAQAPAGVVAAATANLAEQLEVNPAGLALLRAEAVVWSDGCLGVHEPDIDCTDAEVDGFALWLSDGDVAYRYHTDATGSVVRLAESGIALGEVAGAPLPGGQAAPAPPPEPVPLPEGEDEPAPPPEPAPADDPPSPDGMPASGSGGLANDTDAPAWVWAVIAAVALSAIGTGGAYRLWLRSRRR